MLRTLMKIESRIIIHITIIVRRVMLHPGVNRHTQQTLWSKIGDGFSADF